MEPCRNQWGESILSSFRRNAAMERKLTHLARRVALDAAPDPFNPLNNLNNLNNEGRHSTPDQAHQSQPH